MEDFRERCSTLEEKPPLECLVQKKLLENPADSEILLNNRFGQIPVCSRLREEFGALARVHRRDFVHPRTSAIRFATS